jgi:hypothetical protein
MAEMQYDGSIACSDDGLIIRRYDLLLRPKTVPYTEIRRARQVELHGFRFGNWRLWGSSDLRHVGVAALWPSSRRWCAARLR